MESVKKKSDNEKILSKYTTLEIAIEILQSGQLELRNPISWDDKNDLVCLNVYKKKKGVNFVLVACFTSAAETYHHWKIYTKKKETDVGVRIEFKEEYLRIAAKNTDGVTLRKVIYRTIKKIEKETQSDNIIRKVEDIPFIKRWPYRDELEYRMIYASDIRSVKSIVITPNSIARIVVDPWQSRERALEIRQELRSIRGYSKLIVGHASVLKNDKFIIAISKIEM